MPVSNWKYFGSSTVYAEIARGTEEGRQAVALDVLIDMVSESGADRAILDLDHSDEGDPFALRGIEPEGCADTIALVGLSDFILIDRGRAEVGWSDLLSQLRNAGVSTRRYANRNEAEQAGVSW